MQTRGKKYNAAVQRTPFSFLYGSFSLFNLYLMLQLKAKNKKRKDVESFKG